MKINLAQFKAAKAVLQKFWPWNAYRHGEIGSVTLAFIRDIQTGDPVHTLWDTWGNEEKEYRARESQCSDRSFDDHDSRRCVACLITKAIK